MKFSCFVNENPAVSSAIGIVIGIRVLGAFWPLLDALSVEPRDRNGILYSNRTDDGGAHILRILQDITGKNLSKA